MGSLTAALVHPREVFKPAMMESAAAIGCVHVHPSGDPTPSSEDKALAKRLQECSKLLGIRMCDFIVIGDNCYYSFLDEGLLP